MKLFKLIAAIGLIWVTVTLLSILTLPNTSSYMLRGSAIGAYEDNSLSFPIPSPGSYCESFAPNKKQKLFWADLHSAPPVYLISDFGWTRLSTKSSGVALTQKENEDTFNYSSLVWTKVSRVQEETNAQLFLIPKEANLIFTRMYMFRDNLGTNFQTARLGIDYACNKQLFNHVPGASAFCRKDYLQLYLNDYKLKFKSLGLGKCFVDLTPKSFLLKDPNQCKEFIKITDELVSKYNETNMPVEWITKDSLLHKGYGIDLLDFELATYFHTVYNSPFANCDNVLPTHQNMIIQKYINNPALIEGRKFDFRVFLFVANADPLIAGWAPRNGHTRLSDQQFNSNSKDFTTHITANVEIENLKTLEFLKKYRFNLQEIANYFQPQIGDVEYWLENVAYPKLKKILIHMLRASQQNFLIKRVGLFEFYGVDFIMDNTLSNFYLLESNRRPDVKEKNPDLQYRETMIVEDFLRLAEYYIEQDFKINDTKELFSHFQAFDPLIDETLADPYFGVLEKECSVKFKEMNWDLPIDPMIEPLKYYIDNYF